MRDLEECATSAGGQSDSLHLVGVNVVLVSSMKTFSACRGSRACFAVASGRLNGWWPLAHLFAAKLEIAAALCLLAIKCSERSKTDTHWLVGPAER